MMAKRFPLLTTYTNLELVFVALLCLAQADHSVAAFIFGSNFEDVARALFSRGVTIQTFKYHQQIIAKQYSYFPFKFINPLLYVQESVHYQISMDTYSV